MTSIPFILHSIVWLQSNPDLNHMALLRPIILVLWAFGTHFLFCECGEMVTNQFNKFNDALDQCSWYLFSIRMQKQFVIVLANAQQSTNIRGYGNMLCARQSFKTVSMFDSCLFMHSNWLVY